MKQSIKHIQNLFDYHLDLAQQLPDSAFGQKLPVPSNTIGQQFWCIIGARESYVRALRKGQWDGFACSLDKDQVHDKQVVVEALQQSRQQFDEMVGDLVVGDSTEELLLDLLEHESQHQGQLIRYVYGLRYDFPQSWVERWHL